MNTEYICCRFSIFSVPKQCVCWRVNSQAIFKLGSVTGFARKTIKEGREGALISHFGGWLQINTVIEDNRQKRGGANICWGNEELIPRSGSAEIPRGDKPTVMNKLCRCGSFYLLRLWKTGGVWRWRHRSRGGGTQIICFFLFWLIACTLFAN